MLRLLRAASAARAAPRVGGAVRAALPRYAAATRAYATERDSTFSVDDPAVLEAQKLLEQGTSALELGDMAKAKGDYQMSLRVHDSASAHYNLGVVLYQEQNLDGAIAEWNAALRIAPDSPDAHTNIASAYIMLKPSRPDLAKSHLRTASEQSPDDPEIHFNLAAVLEACEELEDAIRSYKAAYDGGIEVSTCVLTACGAEHPQLHCEAHGRAPHGREHEEGRARQVRQYLDLERERVLFELGLELLVERVDVGRVHEEMRLVEVHDDARHLLVNRDDQLFDRRIACQPHTGVPGEQCAGVGAHVTKWQVETSTHAHIIMPHTWDIAALVRGNAGAYAVVLLNTQIPAEHTSAFKRIWTHASQRVCADGGANRLHALDDESLPLPTQICGDLDSLRPDVAEHYKSRGVPIVLRPSQYATDLQKGIQAVEDAEGEAVLPLVLFGGLTGRLDQTVHTLHVMWQLAPDTASERRVADPDDPRGGSLRKRAPTVALSDNSVTLLLTAGEHTLLHDRRVLGKTCGILPLGSSAHVATRGLEWDLDGATTSLGGFLSTSNHLAGDGCVAVRTDAPVYWTVELKPDA